MVRGASRNVVADVAWSRDCKYLMFAAGEGVVAVEFEMTELGGYPVPQSELNQRREGMDQRKRLSMLEVPEVISAVASTSVSQSISKPVSLPTPLSAPLPTPQLAVSTPQLPVSTPQSVVSTSQSAGPTSLPIPLPTPQPSVPIPVPAPLPISQQVKSIQPRKRTGENEESTSRKRKRQQILQPSSEPSPLPTRLCFPAMALTLPTIFPLQTAVSGTEMSLSVQAIPMDSNENVITLLQAMDSSGKAQWSWLGQGRPVLVCSSPHLIVVASQEGLLHTLSTDGRTKLSPLQLTGTPSAIAVRANSAVDRIAALTTDGSLIVWELSSANPLQQLVHTDASWMLQEDTTGVSLQFRDTDAVEVTITPTTSALLSITAKTWMRPDLPLFAVSPYSRSASSTITSSIASNPTLSTLASFTQLESDLFRFRILTPDRSQYERCLSMYAGLINDHKDLRRLRSLTVELKSCRVFVRDG